MSTCISCGSETGSQAFCKTCGASQVCRGCHEPFEEEGRFCTNCGKARTANAIPVSSPPRAVAGNKKKMVVGGGIVLAILLLFFGTKFVNGTFFSSPEKTAQGYLNSLLKGDVAKANDYFNPGLVDELDGVEMEELVGAPITVRSIDTISETSTMANIDAFLVYKENTDEEESLTVSLDVVKVKGKWYINEIY